MDFKKSYLRYLAISYLISAGTTPFFFHFGWGPCLTMFVVSGFVFGSTFFLLEFIARRIRLRVFLLQIFVQSLLIALNIAISFSFVGILIAAVIGRASLFDPALYRRLFEIVKPEFVVGAISVGLLLAFVINSIVAVSKKLGPGVLWNWMTGKYYSPREEELVVMFLDMKDSTTIAESLGTLKFSALVRDFFSDLTEPLQSTGAYVSHYIGDEAVIYWYPQAAVKKSACLRLVPAFQAALQAKSADYTRKYGFMPEFKAGAHIGMVVATEVGDIKSEVVFHGDTLNTAARIQGLCGEESEQFLISSELAERVGEDSRFEIKLLGNRLVKGRAKEIGIFAVRSTLAS